MVAIAGLSAVGALLVRGCLPAGLFGARIDAAAWRAIGAHPTLLRVVAVTAIHASGQFTLFSYIVIAYHDTLAAQPLTITLLLSLNGLAGFVGNVVAGRAADRLGAAPVVTLALTSIIVAFVLWTALFAIAPTMPSAAFAVALVAAVFWGAGNFSANSMQQVRLVDLAPLLAPVSVALNTSAIYFGQFVGAFAGGLLLAHPFTSPETLALPWVALPVLGVAMAASIAAQRRIARVDAGRLVSSRVA
jgi:predicted MFS family arabinose efflux permease